MLHGQAAHQKAEREPAGDFDQLRLIMRTPLMVDLRNIYRRREVEARGFVYECIGRPAAATEWSASEAAE